MDDTDGLDPALEFDEWRARELARLLRDKQAQAERDAEQEEIERRRALPEEQRMAEDMAFADQTRAREKGQMGFMQKYYHRGVFHAVSHPSLDLHEGILIIGWGRGRATQSRLHSRYRICSGYVDVTKSYASQELWEGTPLSSMYKDKTDDRHHVRNIPISQTKIHHQEDGVMQRNNQWVDQGRWERQKQDVGIVEVHIRGKIVRITILMIRWLLSQATRVGKVEIGDTVARIGDMVKEVVGAERGITGKKGKRGGLMKREEAIGQGMRVTLGDQKEHRGREIGRDIGAEVRIVRGIGMIVGEMIVIVTVIVTVTVVGTVSLIGEIEGIRLVIFIHTHPQCTIHYISAVCPSPSFLQDSLLEIC